MTQVLASIPARNAFLQVTALWGMAVAQPLYDILAKNPEFFVVRRMSSLELTLFTVVLSFFFPLLLVVIFSLLRRVLPRIAVLYWGACFFILQTLLSVLLLKAFGVVGWKRLLLAAPIISACCSILYFKFRAVRAYVAVLAAAGFLFPVYFLGAPTMRNLLWDPETGALALTAPERPAPVVLVVLDELPLTSLLKTTEEIDQEHFPNFAKLAQRAHWFPNAWSVSSDTTTAVPAILTGSIPQKGQLPRYQDQPHNIFLLLGSHFKMHVNESITGLCPAEICAQKPKNLLRRTRALISDLAVIYAHQVVPVYFAGELPSIQFSWGNFAQPTDKPDSSEIESAARPVESFENFVQSFEQVSPNREPTFSFLHVLLPHPPWRYFPSGRSYSSPSGSIQIAGFSTDDLWENDEQTVAQAYLRHMLQLRYTDALLGSLVQELERRNLWDPSLFILVADHGASFRAGQNRRAPISTNLVDVLQVPLFIKLPHQAAGIVSKTPAQTTDVLPTIADALGLRIPWVLEGRSLLREHATQPSDVRYLAVDKSILHQGLKDLDRQEALRNKQKLVDNYFPRISTSWGGAGPRMSKDIQTSTSSSCFAWIEVPEAFARVSAESKRFPALLRGQVECVGLPPGPHEIIATLNGAFAGRKKMELADGRAQKFSILLDESLFKAGPNDVRLEIEAGDKQRVRIPAPLNADPPLLLVKLASGQEALRLAANRQITLSPKAIHGNLDIAQFSVDGLALEGWALDAEKRERVKQIAVFCDDRLLTTVPTLVRRLDVATVFAGEDLELSGFQVAVSLDSCGGVRPHRLRVFGVGADGASELSYGPALLDFKEVKFGTS